MTKAEQHAQNIKAMERPFVKDGARFTIHDFAVVEQNGTQMLRVVASAETLAGSALMDRREFMFINPPLKVKDGAGYREDVAAAFQQMLADQL